MKLNKLLKNGLVKDTLIYGLTNALYTGLPLLLLPFLIAVLEPEDYGWVDLFRSISMFMVPVLGLSAVQSIGRFYFDLDASTFKKFVSSIQIFQFFMALLATAIVLIASPWIDKNIITIILLSIGYFFFGQFSESLLVVFRVNREAKKYMIIRILNILLELFLLFILYKILNQIDWKFRVYPSVIANIIIAIICGVIFWKKGFRANFSKKLLQQALLFSTPLILHMVSGYMLNIGDRFFIKYYLTERDLGNYAVAYQIGMAINFFYTSFNLAWTPTYYKWMKEEKFTAIAKVKKMVYLGLIALGIVNFLVWLVANPFVKEYTNYEISTHIVLVILIANVILSFYKFESNFLLYSKKTKKLSSFTLISAIFAIVLNMILIPKIGILGAAYATLTSFIFMYLMIFFNNKNEKNNSETQI